jgi:hypothetical protein
MLKMELKCNFQVEGCVMTQNRMVQPGIRGERTGKILKRKDCGKNRLEISIHCRVRKGNL